MKQRLRNVCTILSFAFQFCIAVCWERKAIVSWERNFKQVTMTVTFYNHLFPDEVAALEPNERQAIERAERGK